jgi:two-component sensor histidine kinase
MERPRVPANEAERLGALAAYRILDTSPEKAFDGLAALAAHLLQVPIVLVSFVDAGRQWFKSAHGLAETETPRDLSFCGHVVADERELEVRDARNDRRFSDNPLVTGDPRVVFYAGMPLCSQDGYVLGTLCAIDHRPRELTSEQQSLLRTVAAQVSAQLELRRRNLELDEHGRAQRALQAQLEGSLREKDVLLQEVHHRVKNNLQLVSSLINLQLAIVDDGNARNALEECQGRIHAVAIVHEAIYSARDYARVPISNYVRSLASSIFHALKAALREIALELEIGDDLQLPVDKAIPCGLILNELISNALRHAFPSGRADSVVRVQVSSTPDAKLEVVVADNGVGLPAGFAPEACLSVGMQVVCALVEQIDGQLRIAQHEGTQFIVTFATEG